MEKLNNLYQGKLLAEAVFLGSTETTPKTQQILAKAQATLVSQLANEVIYKQPSLVTYKMRLYFFSKTGAP